MLSIDVLDLPLSLIVKLVSYNQNMEPKIKYIATDIQIHSRHIRPSVSFENVKKVADKKGSKEIRYYGEIIKKPNGRYTFVFEGDIADKYKNGEISIADLNVFMSTCLLEKLNTIKKKKLKASTKTWKDTL